MIKDKIRSTIRNTINKINKIKYKKYNELISNNIPSDVSIILSTLSQENHKAYIVGGCVRDILLKRNVKDWDITTCATVGQVQNIFKDYQIIETGIQHGTITIVINDIGYEITTFRVDGEYTDNRRPDVVTFTNSIYEDLKRRDLTINALAWNSSEGIIDAHKGIKHLKQKKIQTVGNAHDRFNEDALRMLRAIRFSSVLGFKVKRSTYHAIYDNADLLKNISVERINSEFTKIIMSNNPKILELFYSRVLEQFISEINILNTKKIITLKTITELQTLPQRLAYLFYNMIDFLDMDLSSNTDIEKHIIIESIMRRLKFDNKTIKETTDIIKYYNIDFYNKSSKLNKAFLKRLMKDIGINTLTDIITLRMAYNKANRIQDNSLMEIFCTINKIQAKKEPYTIKDLVVNGKDLINLGFKEGYMIKTVLDYLVECVIEYPLDNTKDKLLNEAKKML
jgi:tRNA nucleotidyltransferase (CCA-adding enzyme)